MEKYKNLLYNYNSNLNKNSAVLYELALERGKSRGWYPKEWNLSNYVNHLFRIKSAGS